MANPAVEDRPQLIEPELIEPDFPAEPPGASAAATCTFGGQTYSVGARVCMGGYYHECDADGSWRPTSDKCP